MENTTCKGTVVYYDGECPVCQREIAYYQTQKGADQVQWVDAASCGENALGENLERSAALRRMHVRLPDGRLVSGAAAFVAMWETMPRWAWLARLAGSGWRLQCLDLAYTGFLKLRRLWHKPAA